MESERWHRIEVIFNQAIVEPRGPDRDALVRSLCAADVALAEAVFALLREDDLLAADEDPLDARLGMRLGPYQIDDRIGRGGMATVYRARRVDEQFLQQVAIKVMDLRLSDPALVALFRNERQILAMLEHPGLTRLLDGGVTPLGEPYLVMELVDGLPIDQYCDYRGLDVHARLRLFAQVCDGVSFAHRNLVLHRDLKPSNILVSTDGRVKIVDFGTAKLLEPGLQATTSGAPLTPAYASPEQLTGRPVGTASDQYSLGLVLFELLSGASAFGERQSFVGAVERAVSGASASPLSTGVTDAAAAARKTTAAALTRVLAGDLATIVGRSLANEPDQRYASVQHLADDLQRWTSGQAVLARPSSLAYRTRKFVARHRLEVAAVVVALVALVGGLLAAVIQARRAEAEADRATAVTRFLTTMLGSADPNARGRDVTVRDVVTKATADAAALDATPQLAAAVRGVIGQTLVGLGDFDEAAKQYAVALAAERRIAPRGSAEALRLLTMASFAHENAGRVEDASRLMDEAASEMARLRDVDDAVRAGYLDQRGRVRAAKGDFAAARAAFVEARTFVLGTGLGPDARANAAGNLAFALANLGEFREARPIYEEAIAETRKASGRDSNAVGDILSPYATVLWYLDERERALGVYEESMRIRRRTLGPEHPNYAMTVLNYADSLVTMGQYDRAVPLLREILALRGKTLPDTHAAVAASLLLMGRALGPMGRLDEAERVIREGLEVRRRTLPAGDWKNASGRSILGAHLALAKRYAEAEPMLLDAERDLVAALGDESAIVADARRRIVVLYTSMGRPADAVRWQGRLPAAQAR
ncbi:MAG TPA: serine/threonine-protein kinase [Luteitalea sp.]|nr:serine/threonine-protein kinase [Luteitalea sp.]